MLLDRPKPTSNGARGQGATERPNNRQGRVSDVCEATAGEQRCPGQETKSGTDESVEQRLVLFNLLNPRTQMEVAKPRI